jgi:hypothetical protein
LPNVARQPPFALGNSDHWLVAVDANAPPLLRLEVELGLLRRSAMATHLAHHRHIAAPAIEAQDIKLKFNRVNLPKVNDNVGDLADPRRAQFTSPDHSVHLVSRAERKPGVGEVGLDFGKPSLQLGQVVGGALRLPAGSAAGVGLAPLVIGHHAQQFRALLDKGRDIFFSPLHPPRAPMLCHAHSTSEAVADVLNRQNSN